MKSSEIISSLEEWISWADRHKSFLEGPVALVGSMGAGKTTAVKFWLEAFDSDSVATSPTFTLIHEYDCPSGRIYHADFYRLNGEDEAEALGIDEIFNSGRPFWMEWPEKIPNLLPPESTVVHIEPQDSGKRLVTLYTTL